MKADWLPLTRGLHTSHNFHELWHSIVRYGQIILFFLTLILIFLWYNSLQSHLAKYVEGSNAPSTTATQTQQRPH
jgi:hypothetical protein